VSSVKIVLFVDILVELMTIAV